PKKKLNAPFDPATSKIVPFDLLPETEAFDLKPGTVPELPPFDRMPRALPYYPEPGPLPTPEESTAAWGGGPEFLRISLSFTSPSFCTLIGRPFIGHQEDGIGYKKSAALSLPIHSQDQLDEVKLPAKLSISKSLKESEALPEKEGDELGEGARPEEDAAALELSSDEAVEVEEVIEESRAERIKRSGLRRVDDFKKAFSKEKMEKTRVRTRENLEKTRLKTKENLEKTRHTLEKRMNKLGTRLVPAERREKLKTSRDKLRKSFTPDHVVYARSKTAVYKVPPFTFHVKKIREGEVEVLRATEMVEVGADDDDEEAGAGRGEAGDLLRGSSPDVHTLLEITEESDAVLVDRSDSD
ncbi:polymerase I and transcript release factor, partial [Carlito syrichta]|uniref:Polymerase I and transcript release factor n=1 Tax=Carlito syrichta TaxID=1868482 RepID=A0A3Q0EEC0_CARSF